MSAPAVLKVARTPTGYCVRIEGRGTMRESRSAGEFVSRAAESSPPPTVVVDLSACEHLDSTFLGCLVEMQRRVSKAPGAPATGSGPRFVVSALKRTAEPPQVCGEWVELPAADPASPDVMRHVLECHRRLAELGGPQQAAFAAIADSIEREMRGKGQGA